MTIPFDVDKARKLFARALIRSRRGNSPRVPNSPTVLCWRRMLARCYGDPTVYKYHRGKGVTVCARWRGIDGLANFLADMGERPDGRSLDRIDPYGNYEPTNCRWATTLEQANNKRTDVTLVILGVSRPLKEWATLAKLPARRLVRRIELGWSLFDVVGKPHRDIPGSGIPSLLEMQTTL